MKPDTKLDHAAHDIEDIFDDEDIEALPAIHEGLADCQAGRMSSSDEVEKRLKDRFRGR